MNIWHFCLKNYLDYFIFMKGIADNDSSISQLTDSLSQHSLTEVFSTKTVGLHDDMRSQDFHTVWEV